MKRIILTFLCINLQLIVFSQNNDTSIKEIFSSILYLSDSIPVTQKLNGKDYEIILKDNLSGKLKPLKSNTSGTGFTIYKDFDCYLITASHVAKSLSLEATVGVKNIEGNSVFVKLKELLANEKALKWYDHPIADVSVLHLNIGLKDTIFQKN